MTAIPGKAEGGRRIGIYVNAGNDVNGNSRRGFIILRVEKKDVTVTGFVNEGSRGRAVWDQLFPNSPCTYGNALDITPAQYRTLNKARN